MVNFFYWGFFSGIFGLIFDNIFLKAPLDHHRDYCPLHKCATCDFECDITSDIQRIVCIRCPIAYHVDCAPIGKPEAFV